MPSTSARLQAGGHGLIEWQSLASHHQFVTGVTCGSVTCLPATILSIAAVTGLWTVSVYTSRCYWKEFCRILKAISKLLSYSEPYCIARAHAHPVVHAVQSIFRGYLRLLNSANFWLALSRSAAPSLAIFCTFCRHAISTARFRLKSPWLSKYA